jgi:hypothetical protein
MLYSLFEVISRQGFSAHAPRPARRAQWPALSLGLAVCALAAPSLADELEFDRDIQPLMAKYCFDCHNTDKAKGDINFERFMTKDAMVEELALWNAASTRITNMEMPPKRADQPSDEERATLVKWIEFLNASSEVDCTQIASEASVNWFPGFVMSRRLNRHEYENTIRDLLGVSVPLAQLFPADGAGGEGFDNHGDALFLSAIQGEKYLEAADLAVETAIPPRPQWPAFAVGLLSGTLDATADLAKTAAQRATASKLPLIAAVPGRGTLPREAASRVVRPFMERAWRRPVQPLEVESVLTMFDRGIARGEDYESAVKMAFKAALVSPNFLFLVEPEPLERGTYLLGDFPLASRLSYFLWSSMPDDQLLTLADHGALSDPEVLRGEVLRMLRDPKSAALGHLFASQWLGITPLGVTAKPDATRFPEFDEPLAASMRRETEYFFNDIVAEDRSLLNLIHSEYTFADERLARLYGLSDVTGPEMQRVQLADATRGGVVGMAAVLTTTSHPLRTSPVLRGKWVLEQLLGDRVPPPPPNVPALPENEEHAESLSLRDRLVAHRANPDCASCHARMDPIGFGLEGFDPIGRWRTEDAGLPIDAKGELPTGETFEGPQGLKDILMARKDDFARNLTRKMLGYALGRSLVRQDDCVVNACMEALQANEYRASHLFAEIVLSYPFRHRFSGGHVEEPVQEAAAG